MDRKTDRQMPPRGDRSRYGNKTSREEQTLVIEKMMQRFIIKQPQYPHKQLPKIIYFLG